MTKFRVLGLAALAGLMAAQGCVSYRSSHGYVLERGEEGLKGEVGLDTKESVLARYGEPSMKGAFDDNAWYYMTSLERSRAFFKPSTQQREVIAFQFDGEGVVKEVQTFTLADGMEVKLVGRETPTRGKELSFWEQLLGNVGQLPAPGQGQQGPR